MRSKTLPLGSIAVDLTSRPVLLIVCLGLLTDLSPSVAARHRARPIVSKVEAGTPLTQRDSQRLTQAIAAVFKDLNHHVPPLCYFGRHPSDASHLGVWVDLGALHRAEESGDLVQAPIESRGQTGRYILDASGAGLTLYRRRGKVQLWHAT